MKDSNKKRTLVTFKIYFDRARMYLGYINFFILNMVLINSVENPTLKQYLNDYKWLAIPSIFVAYVGILLTIGYFDTKYGFRQEELRNNAALNPIMQDLMRKTNDIQMKVSEITDSNSKKAIESKTN